MHQHHEMCGPLVAKEAPEQVQSTLECGVMNTSIQFVCCVRSWMSAWVFLLLGGMDSIVFGPIRWCVWSFRPSSPLRLPHLKFLFVCLLNHITPYWMHRKVPYLHNQLLQQLLVLSIILGHILNPVAGLLNDQLDSLFSRC